jgi:purine-binding chemotaxis protein CheW
VGVIERLDKEILAPASILSDVEYVEGVTKFADGIVFIHDLGGFLSLDEAKQLDEALKNTQDGADHVKCFAL